MSCALEAEWGAWAPIMATLPLLHAVANRAQYMTTVLFYIDNFLVNSAVCYAADHCRQAIC